VRLPTTNHEETWPCPQLPTCPPIGPLKFNLRRGAQLVCVPDCGVHEVERTEAAAQKSEKMIRDANGNRLLQDATAVNGIKDP